MAYLWTVSLFHQQHLWGMCRELEAAILGRSCLILWPWPQRKRQQDRCPGMFPPIAKLFGEVRAGLLEEADPACLLGPWDGKGVAECPPIPSRLGCQAYQLELQVTGSLTLNPSLLTDPKL